MSETQTENSASTSENTHEETKISVGAGNPILLRKVPKAQIFAHVFGCSHSQYYRIPPFLQKRLKPENRNVIVAGRTIPGASLVGFRSRFSSLRVRDQVEQASRFANRIVLAIGQVDLELGFYYRRTVKAEDISPEAFVDNLISIYDAFLKELDYPVSRLALKGVNLTTLENRAFAAKYISRIATDTENKVKQREISKLLQDCYLGEAAQNAMALQFNRRVRQLADNHGCRYFDINSAIASPGPTGRRDVRMGIDRAFIPCTYDHHVTNCLHVRDAHFDGLRSAFPEDWPAPPANAR
ncbi:hypothetical protein ACW9UR_02960 [Halovulum sp. GXIMD14794]